MDKTKRIFIAVELSDIVKEKLKEIQNVLYDSALSIKWVEEENFHITLKFLGELKESELLEVKKNLIEVISDQRSFEIGIDGLDAFPNLKHPKIIWAGIKKNKEKMVNLHEKIEARMVELGFEAEKHDYTPHITLGRLRKSEDDYGLIKEQIKDFPSALNMQELVDKVTIMESELTSEGPIYNAVARLDLKG